METFCDVINIYVSRIFIMKTNKSDQAEPVSQFYTSHRLRLHYTDWGNEHKPVLILLHGGMDHARSWDWAARRLCNDFHVIAPDLRGHGDSSWAPGSMYSILDSVMDVTRMIEKLDTPSVSIIGHSYGGVVSLMYSGLYPDRVKNLALVEGIGAAPTRLEKIKKDPLWERVTEWIKITGKSEKRKPRHLGSIEEAVSRIKKAIPSLSDEKAMYLTSHGIKQNDDGTYNWKYDRLSSILSPIRFTDEEMKDIQKRISCPVLLLYGSNGWSGDPLEGNDTLFFQHAKSICIPDAGHWLHHDQLDLFIEIVKAFMNK